MGILRYRTWVLLFQHSICCFGSAYVASARARQPLSRVVQPFIMLSFASVLPPIRSHVAELGQR